MTHNGRNYIKRNRGKFPLTFAEVDANFTNLNNDKQETIS